MNGKRSVFILTLIAVLAAGVPTAVAVNIWPDRVEPPVKLEEAIRLAKVKIREIEMDSVYCLNATLLNGEDGDTSTGFWTIGFSTELGHNYSVAIRMDGKVSVRKVKDFNINTPYPWPDTITPPISVEEALRIADSLLDKEEKRLHYCLNATLVTGSSNVVSDGMWNFVFQSTNHDPVMINVRMNGKTKLKSIDQIREYSGS